jgi:Glycosyl hydrolases family 2, TIM barrel domain/Glycosyl hydrolases family 2, sugar binding domain/Glycosyl hydrolases family 2
MQRGKSVPPDALAISESLPPVPSQAGGMDASRFAYPRPQMQRSNWVSLNGTWRFCYDSTRKIVRPSQITSWPLEIRVPFPPGSKASGTGDCGLHSWYWYQRDFDFLPLSGRTILRFGAVDYLARVWINGFPAVTHEGGDTPFSADITDMLDATGKQTVTVQAGGNPSALDTPPDALVRTHPHKNRNTAGIWQTVWLEQVPDNYIEKFRWTPSVETFSIGFEARVTGQETNDLTVDVSLRYGEKLIARDRYQVVDREVDRDILLSDPGIDDYRNELLWSPERPTLIDATVRLMRGQEVVDEFTSYTAMRSVYIQRDRFMLNGRPYILKMVLDQGYWPDSLRTAPSDEALRLDVELAKAMGFNGVRKHQKIEDPRYLYWADRQGLMVWEEMPSHRLTHRALGRMVREWTEVIERDYNHPSVIVWVPFTAPRGERILGSLSERRNAVEALYHLTKTLDATRPVIGNDGWESATTDIIGIHDMDSSIENLHQRYGPAIRPEQVLERRGPRGRLLTLDGSPHRGQPVMLTKFHGVGLARHGQDEKYSPSGHALAKNHDEFAQMFAQLMDSVIHMPLFSGFCYTEFADTFDEKNGLLHADRTPKIPIEQIAQVLRVSRTGP